MKKVTKKKVVRKAAPRGSSHDHHTDANNLLIIVAGGFIVLVGLMYMLGTDVTKIKGQYKEVDQVMTKKVEAKSESVMIKDFAYSAETITVKKGTKVTWTNNDVEGHSATADDGSFDTGVLASGESGSVTFDTPGTYGYYCIPHPNMRGSVIVEE